MVKHDDKRQMRALKRAVKRAGNKHRRQELKRQLRDNPEDAHLAEEDLGGCESSTLNGLDRPVGPDSVRD
jgi:hypothetical protein